MRIAGLRAGQELELARVGTSVHELRLAGAAIAHLENLGVIARETLAEGDGRGWTFRMGLRGAITALERETGAEVAWADHRRGSRVRITLADGRRYEGRSHGRWRSAWTLAGAEGDLLEARAPAFLRRGPIRVRVRAPAAEPQDAALLALLLCRVVLWSRTTRRGTA